MDECIWEGEALCLFISAQEREFSVPILSCSGLLRSCIKFAFPRACVPKMPGAQERETRNARPSLGNNKNWKPKTFELYNISF